MITTGRSPVGAAFRIERRFRSLKFDGEPDEWSREIEHWKRSRLPHQDDLVLNLPSWVAKAVNFERAPVCHPCLWLIPVHLYLTSIS